MVSDAVELTLAIDQGTTSTRAIVFDTQAREVAIAQRPPLQILPADSWVEPDPAEIWRATMAVSREMLDDNLGWVLGIGITNQREITEARCEAEMMCFTPGGLKYTDGTVAFIIANTGAAPIRPRARLERGDVAERG